MFDHIRRRLTVGYVGILALILLVFGVVVVFTFYLRASEQQDDLLLQKAEDKANSVLSGKDNYAQSQQRVERQRQLRCREGYH